MLAIIGTMDIRLVSQNLVARLKEELSVLAKCYWVALNQDWAFALIAGRASTHALPHLHFLILGALFLGFATSRDDTLLAKPRPFFSSMWLAYAKNSPSPSIEKLASPATT